MGAVGFALFPYFTVITTVTVTTSRATAATTSTHRLCGQRRNIRPKKNCFFCRAARLVTRAL
jgi:hypothetical protein